jgi:glycerol kinase
MPVNVLAIDQGTSATKALLLCPERGLLGQGSAPVHPRPTVDGGIEQEPLELLDSVLLAGRQALAAAGEPAGAIGLANQGETVLAWDLGTGEPLSPAISWQDRRAAAVCDRLADSGEAEKLTALTGLPVDPYFAAPKMAWLREQGCTDGVVTTTDSWLLHRLTGAFVTDAATASRTLLLDLDGADWSDPACTAFGLDRAALPDVVDCAGPIGETAAFGAAAPVTGLAVDQQAALFAQACFAPGDAKCTYGTGAFLLATTGPRAVRSTAGLSASVAWRLAGSTTYCLDGQAYTAGAAVGWLGEIGLIGSAADLDRLGGAVPDTGGAVFVPGLAGLGAPHWRPLARGSFTGLTLGTTREHLVHAVVEGLAAQIAVLAGAVAADLGRPLTCLRVDGGLTKSRLLLQLQADLLQVPVELHASADATALGVAALARLGSGEARSPAEAVGPVAPAERVEPRMSAGEAAERLARFEAATAAAAEVGA